MQSSDKLSDVLTKVRFGTATKAKVGVSQYRELVKSIHLSGKLDAAEVILREHQTNPYTNVEEIIGDLQLILTDSWEKYRKTSKDFKLRELKLDDLLATENNNASMAEMSSM